MNETNLGADHIGQNLIKLTSNLCFSVFVVSVLIFTVTAMTYQPPNPWLESAPAFLKLFTQTENATFKIDDSVVKTGEDLQTGTAPAVPPADIKPITEEVIKRKEEEVSDMTLKSSGREHLEVVNCSDPRVLITVEKFNLWLFKSVVFLHYQTPVNGSKQDEFDVSWTFGNKKEKSRIRVNSSRSGRNNPKVAPLVQDNEINETIPRLGSETNFRNGKYLYYSRGGDYCKGMNQYTCEFLRGLGEAMYLNRTFVMDLSMYLAGSYNPDGKDQEGTDFRFYFDFEHLKEAASIAEEGELLRDWKKWNRSRKKKVPVKKVVAHKMTPMQPRKVKSTIIWRQFGGQEPENYWHRMCEGRAAKYIQRPWHAV
ncbi:hypothetical protein POTOM_012929 [Populus tomentosa]|uniref:Uncharacterized protein n=1 Tax=Populus tomentosa TaxID=118781 RepID=A0A8X8AAI1_POPTO|nr:hypothetical protein POTOM_012929 [Populus tomentosa]